MKINFQNVFFSYNGKDSVLNNLNFAFNNNQIIFIMGESGSGKSTLIQLINALLLPSKGKIIIETNKTYTLEKEIKEKRLQEIRKECGLVFQFPENQLFEVSVLKDVMFGPLNFYKDEELSKELAIKALNNFKIGEDYYQRSPFELSGGEKRKVALAGVFSFNPSLLMFDEPTSSLDPSSQIELMGMINKLKKDGKGIIIVSHDVDLCYQYADKLMVLKNGEIVYFDEPTAFFDNEELVESTKLSLPFVARFKKKLLVHSQKIRSIDDLSSYLGEHKYE